jgi:hypothetical protein
MPHLRKEKDYFRDGINPEKSTLGLIGHYIIQNSNCQYQNKAYKSLKIELLQWLEEVRTCFRDTLSKHK